MNIFLTIIVILNINNYIYSQNINTETEYKSYFITKRNVIDKIPDKVLETMVDVTLNFIII